MTIKTMPTITSRANPAIVRAAKLQDKKYRREAERFFFEGVKLFSEARATGVKLEAVFVTEDALGKYASLMEDADFDIFPVSNGVYEKISAEKSPEGVFCLAKPLDNLKFHHIMDIRSSQLSFIINKDEKILICDGVRDPGNLGTVIRTANALGFDRLILSADCADVYNPKTVRAAMGGLFRLHLDITDNIPVAIAYLIQCGYDVRAAALSDDAVPLPVSGVTKQTVFVIGNEGHGLSPETVQVCNGCVIIPMAPGAESLNAAIAASLLMWERARLP